MLSYPSSEELRMAYLVPHFILTVNLWGSLGEEVESDWLSQSCELWFISLFRYRVSLILEFNLNIEYITLALKGCICMSLACLGSVFAVLEHVRISVDGEKNVYRTKFYRVQH